MAKKPNILLITSDQQHYSYLGKQTAKLKTPNLDRLTDEGTLFERAYCPNPTCTPSRASILTGMYPSRHGAWSLGTKLPDDSPTGARYLRDQGYETALIGKAHFQMAKNTPEYRSIESPDYFWNYDFWRHFDEDFYGFKHIELLRNHTAEHWVGQHYAMWMEEKGLKNWRKYFFQPTGRMINRGSAAHGKWKLPEEYHYDTWIAERTNALLEEYSREDKPFFLWASFPDPHYPQLVPAPWHKMYKPSDINLQQWDKGEHSKNPPYFAEVFKLKPKLDEWKESGMGVHGLHRHAYIPAVIKRQQACAWGMTSLMDKYIGKILDKVKELGLDDNTLIVFTTDHGDLFGQHGFSWKCIFHYEDLLRIPMIAKYKGHIPAGVRSDSLQSLVDLMPTFMSYCGLKTPDYMQGVDQSKVWNGQESKARDWAICENRHEPHVLHLVSYIEDKYKITVHEGRVYGEMYDLKADPEEHNNIWGDSKYRDIKAELLCRYLRAELAKDGELKEEIKYSDGKNTLRINYTDNIFELDLGKGENVWDREEYLELQINMLLNVITDRLYRQPMWMPRICGA